MLNQIFSFFRLLNSDTGTHSLASGLALGLVFGFSPLLSLQGLVLILIFFFLRVQIGAAFISGFFFKFVAFLLDPIFDSLGKLVLESTSLRPLFQNLYNVPLIPLTRFNNSIVMGSGLLGFFLAIPMYFIFKRLILKYRATVVERFKSTKLWKAWHGTKFYKMYDAYCKIVN